jgi:hypothetical protein
MINILKKEIMQIKKHAIKDDVPSIRQKEF